MNEPVVGNGLAESAGEARPEHIPAIKQAPIDEPEPAAKNPQPEKDLNSDDDGLNIVYFDFGSIMPKGSKFFDDPEYLEHTTTKRNGPDPSKLYFECGLCNITDDDAILFQNRSGAYQAD